MIVISSAYAISSTYLGGYYMLNIGSIHIGYLKYTCWISEIYILDI